jgi:hypothetical protein
MPDVHHYALTGGREIRVARGGGLIALTIASTDGSFFSVALRDEDVDALLLALRDAAVEAALEEPAVPREERELRPCAKQ